MISPSRPERSDVPPAPGLKVRRSEALEEARRRSRPKDISSGTRTLGPSWGQKKEFKEEVVHDGNVKGMCKKREGQRQWTQEQFNILSEV